jgi:PKD repeat protein
LVYNWDFGDGTTSTQVAPPAHFFTQAGEYVVRLVVADSEGLNGTDELVVKVIPEVSLEIHYTNNQPSLTLSGADGSPHIIEVSTNLIDWIPLVTNTPAGGSFHFLDTSSPNRQQRFYRGVKP